MDAGSDAMSDAVRGAVKAKPGAQALGEGGGAWRACLGEGGVGIDDVGELRLIRGDEARGLGLERIVAREVRLDHLARRRLTSVDEPVDERLLVRGALHRKIDRVRRERADDADGLLVEGGVFAVDLEDDITHQQPRLGARAILSQKVDAHALLLGRGVFHREAYL